MLESNIVLGIPAHLEGCTEYAHGILTQEWEAWPCGTPLVFPDSGLKNSNGVVQAMTLTTPSQRCAGVPESYRTSVNVIRPVSLKPLCKNHKTLLISGFEMKKFDRLREYVRDVGGITLLIEFPHGRRKIVKTLRSFENKFKYSSMFYYNAWGSKYLQGEEDRYVCVMSLFDLPYCVPIFNMRKVDGMGVSLSGATVKASQSYGQLHRIFRTDFIYSNYLDNVFVIDGVDVNSQRPMDSSVYKELTQMTSQNLPVQEKKKRKKPSPYSKGMRQEYERYRAEGHHKATLENGNIDWKTYNTVEVHIDESQLVTPEEAVDPPDPSEPMEAPNADSDGSAVQFYNNATQYVWTGNTSNDSSNDD